MYISLWLVQALRWTVFNWEVAQWQQALNKYTFLMIFFPPTRTYFSKLRDHLVLLFFLILWFIQSYNYSYSICKGYCEIHIWYELFIGITAIKEFHTLLKSHESNCKSANTFLLSKELWIMSQKKKKNLYGNILPA